jgi:hypothetical protein
MRKLLACFRVRRREVLAALAVLGTAAAFAAVLPAAASAQTFSTSHFGELDCNGFSPIQESVKTSMLCTDIRGYDNENNDNTWDGRFYDNGHYIGHDEPDQTFLSSASGSGNNVEWTVTIGKDPSALPTDVDPGSDVSHWFQLTPAPWFSMAICDPKSFPLHPCTPESDKNAPSCIGILCSANSQGGGSAFMEFQLYPPGFPPWVDSLSCDDSHWCAALTIDSLECNFGFIQRNGVPTGPPSPQDADLATSTPNSETLLMNPGDTIRFHMWDAPVPGEPGQKAFEVYVDDLTSGQTGWMQASAKNGFMNTSIANCTGTPFNFQPEFNTAKRNHINSWGADQVDISTEFETGHWESCSSITDPITVPLPSGASDTTWKDCHGVYENTTGPDKDSPEISDASCYPAGDTHGDLHSQPDLVTGCLANLFQNGDLDFDGTPYWHEWPTSTTPGTYPGSFVESLPTTKGAQYSQFFFQTDIGLSEYTCAGGYYATSSSSPAGCAVPPPTSPGKFYPYWTRASVNGSCVIEFGNVSNGYTFGEDRQYGTNQVAVYGYPQIIGPIRTNRVCSG